MTCKCFARCEADCVCDHDWTPPAVIALREEVERLRAELAACKQDLRSISDALDDPRCDLTHTMAELISEFRADAQRLLWLTEDHPDQATRKRIRAICESIPVRSLSNLRLNVDEARKGEEE